MQIKSDLLGLLYALPLCAALFVTPAATAQNISSPEQSSCGEIVIAEFAWPAAQLLSRLLEKALRDGYGCRPRRVSASPDVVWRGDTAVASGSKLLSAPMVAPMSRAPAGLETPPASGAKIFRGEEEAGWYIPTWFAALRPEIRSVQDLRGRADIFQIGDRDAPTRVAPPPLYLCPAHWACYEDARAVAETLDLAAEFELVTPQSGEALTASLQNAYANRRPWVGVYWKPSAALAETPMRLLRLDGAEICDTSNACRTPFQAPSLVTTYSASIDRSLPRVAAFLKKFSMPPTEVNAALAWRAANNASMDLAANAFLAEAEKTWKNWFDEQALSNFTSARSNARSTP